MIRQFDSTYAGHIDLENVGYADTPVNYRQHVNRAEADRRPEHELEPHILSSPSSQLFQTTPRSVNDLLGSF